MEELLPLCYGELNLKPWEIERLCVADIEAMLDGWQRRYDKLEDLFIGWIAYPMTVCVSGKNKAPKLESFYKHRLKRLKKSEDHEAVEASLKEEFGI